MGSQLAARMACRVGCPSCLPRPTLPQRPDVPSESWHARPWASPPASTTRHRRGRHGQPAGQRPHGGGLVRAGRHRARRSATTPPCGSSSCGPRAGASTPASTSRRCRRPRASRPSIGANRGCYAAFAAVYECAVPVIAAVNGFCLGGGIGLVGNADVIVAADDATFGLPEVDRGALGAATHLSRLVPQHKMRAMVYTSATATAARAARVRLGAAGGAAGRAARRRRSRWPARSRPSRPTVIRAAKESLNGIDLWDVKRSYRFEQGFTFELNLSGVADEHRDAFVDQARTTDYRRDVSDKRMTEDGRRRRLRDGHDDRHRRVGQPAQADVDRAGDPAQRPRRPHDRHATAGPTSGCCARPARCAGPSTPSCSLDTIPLEPHFRAARQSGAIEDEPLDEGMFLLGLQAAAWRVPFLPTRVGLGSDLARDNQPDDHVTVTVARTAASRGARRRAGPPARRRLCPPQRGRRAGQRQFLGPDLYFDDLMLQAAPTGAGSSRSSGCVDTADLAGRRHAAPAADQPADGRRRGRGRRRRPLHAVRPRLRRGTRRSRRRTRPSAKSPEAWAEFRADVARHRRGRVPAQGAGRR